MGKLLHVTQEKIIGHDGLDPILIIDNWRAIKEAEDGLIVIINTCERFFIPNLTMKDFHDINDNNKEVKMAFEYIENNISCRVCHGVGVLDWIDNIFQSVNYEQGMASTHKRNPKTPIREIDGYYVSSPIVGEAQMLCKTCLGTGLHMFNENAYLEMIESERRTNNG